MTTAPSTTGTSRTVPSTVETMPVLSFASLARRFLAWRTRRGL
jgi:hypothetical protein